MTNLVLLQENQRLREENQKLSVRICQLEEQLNTNSRNSSKSPSQDPFRQSKLSPPSGRKQGGQPGHPGHSRKMMPLDAVTRIVEIKPGHCPRCGMSVFKIDPVAIKYRQVVELSTPSPDVTQYNICTCRCSTCGMRVKAKVPQEAKSSFGPRLKAFLTMLSGEAHVTKRKIYTVLRHLGIDISLGSICNAHHLASILLQKSSEDIRAAVL